MKFELTQEQLNNLDKFLSRVDLKWSEALAFTDILQAFSNPIKEEDNI